MDDDLTRYHAWRAAHPEQAARYADLMQRTSYAVDRSLNRPLIWKRKRSRKERMMARFWDIVRGAFSLLFVLWLIALAAVVIGALVARLT